MKPLFYSLGVACFVLLSPAVFAQTSPDYIMSVDNASGAQGGTAQSTVLIDSSAGLGLQGWSFGVCHDASDLTAIDAQPGEAVLTAKNGEESDFFSISIFDNGVNCGVVVCLVGCAALPAAADHELLYTTYDILAPLGTTTDLELCDEVGDPTVFIALVDVNNLTIFPTLVPGSIEVTLGFRRGDTNSDGLIDISDALFLASWLFGVGPVGTCEDAGDINDNGALEGLVDSIALLTYLFSGGPQPPTPFPGCGGDLTDDALGCVSTAPCP